MPTAAGQRKTNELFLADRNGIMIGRLRFSVCRDCGTGRVIDVWVPDEWQRQGLGRELVHAVFLRFPGLQWNTTAQPLPGRLFFKTMSEETSAPLQPGHPLCPHVAERFTRAWRRAVKPVA
ncbi:GNAT family N-acetyltransferase [Streptomyces sp. NPDC048324]|uniref:GNAT family N-acetyltransferase n=1 Tax=Streptomyces sp. NPDC048324 TaxID=3157205 RepID=UPI0034270A0A